MRTVRLSLVGTVTLVLLATSSSLGVMPARSADTIAPGLVTGPTAQATFETLARDGAVTFTDFESVPTGPHLKLKLDGPAKGITVKLRTTQFRYPLPPKRAPKDTPVLVLPYGFVSEPANHRLMGSNPGDTPDGQAKYKLVFSKPVGYVGLLRMWNTYSLTRFFNQTGTLVAEHQNTENHEFVRYVAAGPGDRIKTIEFDGVPEQPGNKQNKIFQVGSVDDLYVGYGSARSGGGGEEESSTVDEAAIDEHLIDQAGETRASSTTQSDAGKRDAGMVMLGFISLVATSAANSSIPITADWIATLAVVVTMVLMVGGLQGIIEILTA